MLWCTQVQNVIVMLKITLVDFRLSKITDIEGISEFQNITHSTW
jgi:hypothetical protein